MNSEGISETNAQNIELKDLETLNLALLCEKVAEAIAEQIGGSFSVRLNTFAAKPSKQGFPSSSEISFAITDRSAFKRSIARDSRLKEGFFNTEDTFSAKDFLDG